MKTDKNTHTATAWKKNSFILSKRSDFYMVVNLEISVHAFTMIMLISLSLDEILLPKCMNYPTNFRVWLFNEEMVPF